MPNATIIHFVLLDEQMKYIIPILVGYHFLLIYLAPDIKKIIKLWYNKIKSKDKKIGF